MQNITTSSVCILPALWFNGYSAILFGVFNQPAEGSVFLEALSFIMAGSPRMSYGQVDYVVEESIYTSKK